MKTLRFVIYAAIAMRLLHSMAFGQAISVPRTVDQVLIKNLAGGTTTSGVALCGSTTSSALGIASWASQDTACIGFSNGVAGQLVVSGKVDFALGGLTPNQDYYLGANGTITTTPGTTTPGYITQKVIRATGTNTGIFIGDGDLGTSTAGGSSTLDGLTDVIITSPAAGQFLTHNGADWVNGTSGASIGWGGITGSVSSQVDLQAELDGKQATLGYTPVAATLGSVTSALGYTPVANTSGSITTVLGYTPVAATLGSVTSALGYTPEDAADKDAVSGYPSLDANSKVTQNPASGTSTPGVAKMPVSLGTGFLDDAWLSSTVTKLGNTIALGGETTGTTDDVTEGSTNKYYTDAKVNAAVGSTSVAVHNNVDFPTTVVNGQILKYNSSSGQWENGTDTAGAPAWGDVTGTLSNQTDLQSALDAKETDLSTVSQAEAEAGTSTADRIFTAQRVKQAIDALAAGGTTTPTFSTVNVGTTTAGNAAKISGSRMTTTDLSTSLLLHAEGADASTTITDSGVTVHTVTAVGNAQIDSAQYKFGTGSVLLDGTGDYMTIPDHADWNWGSGNFTIDFQVRFAAVTGDKAFFCNATDGSTQCFMYHNGTTNTMYFTVNAGATALTWSWTPTTSVWYHVALVRQVNTFKVYIDGVSLGEQTYSGTLGDYTGTFKIASSWNGGANYINGWLDEFRISKGSARWTANFTAPTSAYSVSSTVDTVCITDVSGDGSEDVSFVVGSTTSSAGRTLEVASGKTTLADSWDTRCDPKLKVVVGDGETIIDRVYDEAKKPKIKDWLWKTGDVGVNTGPMIDDPNIPETLIWRDKDGIPGGFRTTSFMSYLYSLSLGIIKQTENRDVGIEAEIAALRIELEILKNTLNPKP